ncbi:MAG TPA: RES family NAD+ phosphorylase [Vicinamibacterales bacterium]|nr:RES family NAD+ phosphorylase [Vicinamibacterales bacterium]
MSAAPEAAARRPGTTRVAWRGASRLIPSRYPSVGLFDRVAVPADLEAVFELEGWTNDRISNELGALHAVPRGEWVTGPMATVVMAAFCHPRAGGGRFNSARRGAWYAAKTLETALSESTYRRTRELEEIGAFETRVQMRLYRADFRAAFHDIRPGGPARAALYDPDDYSASQAFAEELLAAGSNGILYRSVRDISPAGGECLACFRPRLVANVRVAGHYEYVWEGSRTPRVRKTT